jgi:hypothetical protein
MALLDTDPASAPLTSENRRYQRVKVDLLGRYMLEDRREFPCQVINMSPGGLALIAPACGRLGERVVAYVDHVGRLEGLIARVFPSGFSMTIAASQRKRDKLAAQLTWLANRHILDTPEDRRHQRSASRDQMVTLTLADGSDEQCSIVDLSVSGVAVVSLHRPPLGSAVRVGKAPGRVVRHLDNGFAVECSRRRSPNRKRFPAAPTTTACPAPAWGWRAEPQRIEAAGDFISGIARAREPSTLKNPMRIYPAFYSILSKV